MAEPVALPRPRRRLRLGMVGGGRGSFFGPVHARAARYDDRYELVAGVLSRDPRRALESAADWFIAPDRSYADYRAMAAAEAARPDGIDVVSIVTPNDTHYDIACAFIDAGINVICEKPMTTTLGDALDLVARVRARSVVFAVVYTLAGFPMVRQARAMVQAGELGAVRVVDVELLVDWLTQPVERAGNRQAEWRTDPAQAGPGGALGDIAVHAYHLAGYVIGLELEGLSANLHTFVPGRRLDDDCQVQLRYRGGARGRLWASEVAVGNDVGIRLRVYGEKAGLEWLLAEPNRLRVARYGEAPRYFSRGADYLHAAARRASGLPVAHSDTIFAAIGNLFSEVAVAVECQLDGRDSSALGLNFPDVHDGARGVGFVEAVLASSQRNGAWTAAAPVA